MLNTPLHPEERAMLALRSLYAAYGYTPFKMTKFEEYDLYLRNKNFLISDHIITFTDTDGKLMALKPDVTLSIVKYSKDEPSALHKVYYNENVYRVSGKSGSYREIMQTGLECIGDVDRYCLSEVLSLAVKSLDAFSADSILTVSDLDLVLAAIAETKASPAAQKQLLSLIGEKNLHGIGALCREEGIEEEKTALLKALVACYGKPSEVIKNLSTRHLAQEMQMLLEGLADLLKDIPSDKIRIDFSTVGDLGYYNGIVFKGFVNGIPTDVLSGGQYDRLMQRMGRQSKAVGFAVYLDLIEALDRSENEYDYDTVILYTDDGESALVAKTAEALVQNGERVICLKRLPEKKRYRKAIRIEKGEVTSLA